MTTLTTKTIISKLVVVTIRIMIKPSYQILLGSFSFTGPTWATTFGRKLRKPHCSLCCPERVSHSPDTEAVRPCYTLPLQRSLIGIFSPYLVTRRIQFWVLGGCWQPPHRITTFSTRCQRLSIYRRACHQAPDSDGPRRIWWRCQGGRIADLNFIILVIMALVSLRADSTYLQNVSAKKLLQ